MKKNNIILGLACAFLVLAVASLFITISVQVITTLSICSLLFSIAQVIQSYIDEKGTEEKAKFDALVELNNIEIDDDWKLMFKNHLPWLKTDKKEKTLRIISCVIECASVVVLVCGLVVPLSVFENEKIGTACTIGSFSAIFLSIWLTGIIRSNTKQWNELQMFGIAQRKDKKDIEEK